MNGRSTPSESESERQCPNLGPACEYAEHVWDETLIKRKLEVYPAIAAQIYHQVREGEISRRMTKHEVEECLDWVKTQVQEIEALQKNLEVSSDLCESRKDLWGKF